MTGTASLAVHGLRYSFGKTFALDGVSLVIQPGEFKLLLGPNGAGKTTLFSLITRLYEAPEGSIHILGHDLRKASIKALAHIGVVFQQPTLDLDLTVRQNLRYHAALHGMARREADKRIDAELARFGMAERQGEKVRLLNGGHRRRVEIARALLHRPGLLLLDEPTVGLDVPARRGIVDHVHRLCAEDGIAVLWATHLIDEVLDGDHVVVLHKGQVRAQGGADEVTAAAGCATIADAFNVLTGPDAPRADTMGAA